MFLRRVTLTGVLLALTACGSETPQTEPAETETGGTEISGPALLALHLYNPASDEAHRQLVDGLGQLNQAISEAGHPDTGYQVWRVTGEQAGEHGYLFGSIWTDQATYDAVHAHEAYTTATATLEAAGIAPPQDQVYNRYVELNPPAEALPPMPEGATPLLALHLFNLPSEDSEAEFIAMLEDLNEAVAAAGHPETRYSLWKVTGEQSGTRAYLFGSVWADVAAYEAVHAHPSYQSVAETLRPGYEQLVIDEVYNRFEYVGPA